MLDALDEVDNGDQAPSWIIFNDQIGTPTLTNKIALWMNFKRYGVLPRVGGWLDQPLDFISAVSILDFLVSTHEDMRKKEWEQLSQHQIDFIQWIMKDENEESENA